MSAGNPNFVKGHKRQGGRLQGTQNKISKDIKEAFKLLIEKNIENLSGWLDHVAKKDPEKAFNIIIDLSEFIIPKQKRTELTSKGGKDLFPKGGAELADEIYIKRNYVKRN